MSDFLLDANVISELVKPGADPKVVKWIEATDESLSKLSVLTLGEIRKGIECLPHRSRGIALESWLSHDLISFANRILGIDQAVADRRGRISARAEVAKHPLPVIDGMLAATALHHNLTFGTRNAKHVAITGVPLFNPWER